MCLFANKQIVVHEGIKPNLQSEGNIGINMSKDGMDQDMFLSFNES